MPSEAGMGGWGNVGEWAFAASSSLHSLHTYFNNGINW